MKIYLNGRLLDKSDAKISVFDHGLLYGDGVFEGIRSYNCLIFRLKDHIERLYNSAAAIMLESPLSKEGMVEAIVKTLKANKLKDAYIRVVITRGEGDLGLDPRKCKNPSIFIIADKIALYPEEFYKKGLEINTVPTRRNINEALSPQIKSLNYLNNIMAKLEAINCKVEEALMLTQDGYLCECSGDNIFLVKGSKLLTPQTSMGILAGITRAAIMDIAVKRNMAVSEAMLTRYDLFSADEVFLTGTAAEIIPVVKIDGRRINNGKPGNITLVLKEEFSKLTKIDGYRYSL
ncbi:MAG: branched-chain-amino-acid transaminase [Candidatus Omnitrophica bacterium CG11_big_fil_rev_8_21_14_0_20_42_13]|uniref:Branched-chain-amino-acid aminotransferase n=1 Tax=Candidatus Ghiorseimicrobium undicola TaxID=1974746 RepID=A0A2H0LW03_9BACT|nr:MAG: branched-chain-amino-acid transaminase [Candidatus Omnitrophica bacterium CG11_big_fil_rev_8_21_14_0_20_42_13]